MCLFCFEKLHYFIGAKIVIFLQLQDRKNIRFFFLYLLMVDNFCICVDF